MPGTQERRPGVARPVGNGQEYKLTGLWPHIDRLAQAAPYSLAEGQGLSLVPCAFSPFELYQIQATRVSKNITRSTAAAKLGRKHNHFQSEDKQSGLATKVKGDTGYSSDKSCGAIALFS